MNNRDEIQCNCLTALADGLLIPQEDEIEFEEGLNFIQFNFCPFCGKKVDRSWRDSTVGQGGDCVDCE